MSIEVRNITKTFGSFTALKDVSLTIPTGGLVALLGPSGSGKTTLLRVIAGLEDPDAGEVLFHGQDATHKKVAERRVGFVFQHYALFRHMNVFENVAFGLRVRPRKLRPSKAEIRDKVLSLLRMVQLEAMAFRMPSQLSGGQRQRVALARALAVEPQVLLLDEPFGALDAKVRQELRRWLRRLHDDLHITSVFVTHDQEEALEVADTVVVMNQGQIEQIGSPEEVYDHPATTFVYQFLGEVNLFEGRAKDGRVELAGLGDVPGERFNTGEDVVGYVRPHDFDILLEASGSDGFSATVKRANQIGAVVRLELERTDTKERLEAELPRDRYAELQIKPGQQVFVKPRRLALFAAEKH